MKDPFYEQKAIANRNRERIVKALTDKPLIFSELREALDLSKPVLDNHLKFLISQRELVHNKKAMPQNCWRLVETRDKPFAFFDKQVKGTKALSWQVL